MDRRQFLAHGPKMNIADHHSVDSTGDFFTPRLVFLTFSVRIE